MIEKINNYDKIISRTSTGKTLDMSGGRKKRTYTMRNKDGIDKQGDGHGGHPKNI